MTAVIQGAGLNWRRNKIGREGERENVRKQERGKAACQPHAMERKLAERDGVPCQRRAERKIRRVNN